MRRFKLPKQFSLRTMKALEGKDKMAITNAVRCEIVTSIATLVMVHTIYPTPEQYTTISERLVATYPILADSYGCGYVSYEEILVNAYPSYMPQDKVSMDRRALTRILQLFVPDNLEKQAKREIQEFKEKEGKERV